jgi:hypothetical protein
MDPDKTRLLFGPYAPPPLKVGDRVMCLYRDVEVVIFDWSLAPIPWPLCYVVGTRAAGKGLLVEDELARAIRHESALALEYWWGVCGKTVNKWRHALGVGRTDSQGSQRLIRRAALDGLNARRRSTPVRLWAPEELALLGKLPDAELARLIGRSITAVAKMRCQNAPAVIPPRVPASG